MKIQRTIPPAAAPINLKSLLHGFWGMLYEKKYLNLLEEELRAYFGVRHVFLVSSGKTALTIILEALSELAPGKRKALIPAYTCFSVPSAIVRAKLKISLCDVDDKTFDFDYGQLPKEVNADTLCIIPSHLFGIPSDLDAIRELSTRNTIYVVEDAAQAMGCRYKGDLLGTVGDVGFLSLGRGKNVTCGSGGIIVTHNDIIAAAIEKRYASLATPQLSENIIEFIKALFMAFFINPSFYWLPSGLPFLKLGETKFEHDFDMKKLSGMKAGLMRNWQTRLEQSNRKRQENGEYYQRTMGFKKYRDSAVPYLRLPFLAESRKMRDTMYNLLKGKGIGVSRMYPSSINNIKELKDQFHYASYPASEEIAEKILTIPTHELLSEKDREVISSCFRQLPVPAIFTSEKMCAKEMECAE